jgi:CRISPR/Cas system-associated exonuclease Cas4 (RecB family)
MTTIALAGGPAEQMLTTAGFDRVLREQLESEIRVFPARSWYPSTVGHPCDRFLTWNWTRWEAKTRHSAELQAVFNEGREHQPSIYRRLEQLGFEIVRESDRPVQYRIGHTAISGRPDGRIIGWRGVRYRPPLVLEIKALAGYEYDRLHTVEDLRRSPRPFTQAYYSQGMLGCFLENVPSGVFVLKNKQSGMLKLLPFELDYGHVEWVLARLERLEPMVLGKQDPPPLPYTWQICGRCDFKDQCYPARSFGEGADVITDELFIEDLARREALKPGADEYRELHESILDRLKLLGTKSAIAGDFVIEGRQRLDGVVIFEIRR